MTDIFKNQKTSLWLHTPLHMIVDFSCIYLMSRHIHAAVLAESAGSDWLMYVIMYNFFAFAVQLPIGVIGDRLQRNNALAAAGIGCILAAYICISLLDISAFPAVPVIAAGLGNAMFHIGGGIDVLQKARHHCTEAGIFVSSGALGVFAGKWLPGKSELIDRIMLYAVPALLLTGFIFALCAAAAEKQHRTWSCCFSLHPEKGALAVFCAVCCIIVVVLRSFAGCVFIFPWSAGWLAFAMTAGVAAGKALGGIAADRFGTAKTVIASLAGCAMLFMGGEAFPLCGILAVFLFNMTMPITLTLLADVFPKAKGTAFGALTFAIFIGIIPSFFMSCRSIASPILNTVLSLMSLVLLIIPVIWNSRHRSDAS